MKSFLACQNGRELGWGNTPAAINIYFTEFH